jgi:hypothetical protein
MHTLRLRSYAEIERALAHVREAGAKIEELELLQPDLEDVFVQIMSMGDGGAKREERSAASLLSPLAFPNP